MTKPQAAPWRPGVSLCPLGICGSARGQSTEHAGLHGRGTLLLPDVRRDGDERSRHGGHGPLQRLELLLRLGHLGGGGLRRLGAGLGRNVLVLGHLAAQGAAVRRHTECGGGERGLGEDGRDLALLTGDALGVRDGQDRGAGDVGADRGGVDRRPAVPAGVGDGTGGAGYTVQSEEPPDGAYKVGSVAWAKAGTDPPGTASSQFFIVTGNNGAGLPAEYGWLGSVTSGLEVAQTIESLGTVDGPPQFPVYILSVTISES